MAVGGLAEFLAPGTLGQEAGAGASAYLMIDAAAEDGSTPAAFDRAGPSMLREAGGRVLVDGGQSNTLEGSWRPARLVLVEFSTLRSATLAFTSIHQVLKKESPRPGTRRAGTGLGFDHDPWSPAQGGGHR